MNEWILVVDDDVTNLRIANQILSSEKMRVSAAKSGEQALEFLNENTPDLILLDVHMTGINGFETLAHIKANKKTQEIPVILLTADDDKETETKALRVGATDFIKKPFVPDVLLLRVKHTTELTRLQRDLTTEVEKKTSEIIEQHERIERMTMQIVQTLSGAIDAKDSYTNGHSLRVAEYSRRIARRAGLSEEKVKNIYMMALLHDIGKIGIPDTIINKPGKLSSEEFAIIKAHPSIGAKILENITEFPDIAVGAHFHHERYDGKGYPEGLKGEEIPESARIIAVADCYDALTSKRSYRDLLPQRTVRDKIEKDKGLQFDPKFAQIMLEMIDEDKDYTMREDTTNGQETP
ncbi:MAG: response regulator [Treponema sp.]|nr:response regulator [Treponema sp.]